MSFVPFLGTNTVDQQVSQPIFPPCPINGSMGTVILPVTLCYSCVQRSKKEKEETGPEQYGSVYRLQLNRLQLRHYNNNLSVMSINSAYRKWIILQTVTLSSIDTSMVYDTAIIRTCYRTKSH